MYDSKSYAVDTFLRKYDASGNELWTRLIVSSLDVQVLALCCDSSGIYVGGSTSGVLPGETNQGGRDAFVCKYDADGNQVWALQFGTGADDEATAVSVSASGIYVGGNTNGTLTGCSSQGSTDAFLLRMTLNAVPDQPVNMSPANGAGGVSLTPTLRSSTFSDPDVGDAHTASQWQVATTSGNYSNPVFDSDVDTSNRTQVTVPPGILSYATTYYWRVRHRDGNGNWSDWSAETSFTTFAALPAWQWQNPLPQGNRLRGVWGSSATDVFAVGDGGTILHCNSSVWSIMSSGVTDDLAGIWGSCYSDVFAAGANGTIIHYDGSVWGTMTSATASDLAGIWGSSSCDAFAAGDNGTILHYDGIAWSPMSSGTTQALHGVWGTSPSDVFAVGGGWDSYPYDGNGIIVHYDGSTWSPMISSTTDDLTGVWGNSPSDVFAVGFAIVGVGDVIPYRFTVLRYDGSAWNTLETGEGFLNRVWASSATELFAVGGDTGGWAPTRGTILHYDGSGWSTTQTDHELNGIWGNSSSDVYAVGDYGTILHYDGVTWSPMSSGTTQALHGVWGTSPSDVFAVGGGWNMYPYDGNGIILHYDGSEWSPMSSGTTDWLWGVWGSSPTDVFAVGGWWDEGNYGQIILHYDGTTWSEMPSGIDDNEWGMFYDVWGSSATDVFVVGLGGILHYDGTTWSEMPTGDTRGFSAIWGSSSSDVYAVGRNGTILHYDGRTWSAMTSGTTSWLSGVWGSSATDIFAVGSYRVVPSSSYRGTILHYDGSAWSNMTGDTVGYPEDVHGSSSSDVYAVGSDTILHYDGSAWSTMTSGTTSRLEGIWGSSSSDVFAVGDGGMILHSTGAVSPVTATEPATNVTHTSAELRGNLTSLGTASSAQVSFEWGTATGSYTETTEGQELIAPGVFSYELSGLTSGATCYYRAKAVGDGTSYGAERSFTTTTTPPTVTTIDASNTTIDSARLNGDLTSLGTAGSVTVSFQWGTISGDYGCETTPEMKDSTGTFYFDLSGLASGTTFYYRAKAVGHGEPVYGVEKGFTADQSPKVEDVVPSSGKRDQHLTVTISGVNFDGATAISFGLGITVEDFSINSDTEITAEIAIEAKAAKGTRDVSVTTGWGTATKSDGFSVVGGEGGVCSSGAPAGPGAPSEMTTVLAALGLLLGVGYWLVRRGARNSVRA